MSGTVVFATNAAFLALSGVTVQVQDSSCAALLLAIHPRVMQTYQLQCSANVVVTGTTIKGGTAATTATTLGTVSSISAPAVSTLTDIDMLTVVLVVAVVLFSGFFGYRSGYSL